MVIVCLAHRRYICTPRSHDLPDQVSVRSDSWLSHHKKWYNSWTNDWIILKFLSEVYLVRMHDIIHRFLIWPTFEGHRGQITFNMIIGKPHLTWSSSVSMACFVTAGAIDLKLCTYVPLGKNISTSQTTFWSLGLATKTENTKSATTPELMAGSSPNHRYIDMTTSKRHR
jgi:hypothetical protein